MTEGIIVVLGSKFLETHLHAWKIQRGHLWETQERKKKILFHHDISVKVFEYNMQLHNTLQMLATCM